jgi:hypothetical protein
MGVNHNTWQAAFAATDGCYSSRKHVSNELPTSSHMLPIINSPNNTTSQ